MKSPPDRVSTLQFWQVLATLALALPATASAQAVCASDGQPRPVALMERFINADCETCWRDPATRQAGPGQAVLDWVLPGSKGDDAPLSAVASRDGLKRLQALGRVVPQTTSGDTHNIAGLAGTRLRVARGLALSGYVGASIELKPLPASARGQDWTAWIALVESLPKGTEGSPVARNLVRNLVQVDWNGSMATAREQKRLFESRVMGVASGANPERLGVIGWVQNNKGEVLVAAQSRCRPGR
ncbi:MAG: hypothetical protein V4454_05590 [Pseudomonadota bacterium]